MKMGNQSKHHLLHLLLLTIRRPIEANIHVHGILDCPDCSISVVNCNTRGRRVLEFISIPANRRDKEVEPARNRKKKQQNCHDYMTSREAENVERVTAIAVKDPIRETKNYGEDRS